MARIDDLEHEMDMGAGFKAKVHYYAEVHDFESYDLHLGFIEITLHGKPVGDLEGRQIPDLLADKAMKEIPAIPFLDRVYALSQEREAEIFAHQHRAGSL